MVLLAIAARHRLRSTVANGKRNFQTTRFTSNPSSEWVTAAAISSDGGSVVFAEPHQLRIRSVQGADETRIAIPELRVIDRLAWFADGNQFLASGLNPASGTPEVWLYSRSDYGAVKMRSDARFATPSPLGSQIALTDGSMSELWIVDVMGQQPRRVLQHSANTTFKPLSWMPNGRSLLIQRLEYG